MDTKIITVYGTTWCADCKRAKAWFNEHHIPFSDINIEKDEAAVEYVLKVNNGMQTVPTIVFPNGEVLTEPSNTQLEQKIKSLGLL